MAKYTSGSARVPLEQPDLTTFQNNGSVVLDSRRSRPLWFEGRFMAARDLEREQNYFLQREADLGQASGFEGIRGLMVDEVASTGQSVGSGAVVIHAGEGVTPAGELVTIPQDLTIELADLPEQSDLGIQLTSATAPQQPPAMRTGLYIVALQPVEYTGNPVTAYPTTIQGPRGMHDGDIIQATAVSLVPYPNPPANYPASLQQAALARQIFVTGGAGALPDSLLPLAVISLNRGAIQWLDSYMVRRDRAAAAISFGVSDDAAQEAYLQQYDTQLQAVVAARHASGLKANFAAADFFEALPGMGRIPLDGINTGDFSQVFFPQEMDVRLSIVPDDELPALLADGLSLPAIDLTLPPNEYANMSVFVLIPVPRANFGALAAALPDTPLNPTLPQVLANRSPLQLLRLYQGVVSIIPVAPVANNAWTAAIGTQKFAFYLRRRSDSTAASFKTPAGIVTLSSSANPATEGAAVTFTAQVLPANATGNVQFMNDQTPLGTGALSGGVATLTTSFATAGTFPITAVYAGSTTANAPAVSATLNQVVAKKLSTVTLASSQNPSTFGQQVTLTATLTPNTATGSVVFSGMGTAAVSAGAATLPISPAAGSYAIAATYGGDNDTAGSTSNTLTQTVQKGTSQVALGSSLNPATVGQSITLTAKVSPDSATGTVRFLDGAALLAAGTLSGGIATFTTSALAAGPHVITAVYDGDSNNLNSQSTLTQTVNKTPSSVALASSQNPSLHGQAVTLTATITPATATGSVQFMEGTTTLGAGAVTAGVAPFTITTLAVGPHNITAIYQGDSNTANSTSNTVAQTVNKLPTTTALSSSLNPSTQGQAVTFTANVTPKGATGAVQFLDGPTVLGTGTLAGGAATFSSTTLAAGPHTITAVYGGDVNSLASNSPAVSQLVKAASGVTLASSLNPSNPQQQVVFTATVTPKTATGSVQFLEGTTVLGAGILSSGVATLPLTTLPSGVHNITASYGGDANNAAGSSPVLAQTVRTASGVALTSSLNPSIQGDSVTFTATVTPTTATGSVQFMDGTTVLNTATVTSGVATFSLATLSAGAHNITAVYGGDGNNTASTSPALTQNVKVATSVALTSSVNPSNPQQQVAFTATVTPKTATGSVQFKDGSTVVGTVALSGGAAAFPTSTLSAGTHTVTAVYTGDSNNAASTSSAVTQTVREATTVVVSSSVNPSDPQQAVTFTATVTPSAATGTVQFTDGSTVLGPGSLSGGGAQISVTTLTAGAHNITATYQGDTSHASSTSAALPQTVRATTSVALQSSANPSNFQQILVLTATVTPKSATGAVRFLDGSTEISTATLNGGVASLLNTTLGVGGHSITAVYGGDANNTSSTSPALAQTVKNRSSVGLNPLPSPSNFGQQVTLTATVTPANATGSVQFLDGTTVLGAATLSAGVARIQVPATPSAPPLAAGTHSLTAAYAGDATNNPATSPAVTQTVRANSSATLTASPPIVIAGSPVTLTATITPASATGNVQFMNGAALLATSPVSSGQAIAKPTLPAGNYSITAVYSGDANNTGSTSNVVAVSVQQLL